MVQKLRMKKIWNTPFFIKRNTAKVLCIDSEGNIDWDNGTAATCAHYGYQDITWPYCISLEFLVFLFCDVPALAPREFIFNGIIYSQNSNTFIYKFAMKQLTAEGSSSNRPSTRPRKFFNGYCLPTFLIRVSEYSRHNGIFKQRAGVGEVLFGIGDRRGDSREGFIENGDDAFLFGEGRKQLLDRIYVVTVNAWLYTFSQ